MFDDSVDACIDVRHKTSTNSVMRVDLQAILLPSAESLRRLYTLESELALLLRVGFHNRKRGAQTLYAMGALRHLSSCRAIDAHLTVRRSFPSVF